MPYSCSKIVSGIAKRDWHGSPDFGVLDPSYTERYSQHYRLEPANATAEEDQGADNGLFARRRCLAARVDDHPCSRLGRCGSGVLPRKNRLTDRGLSAGRGL